MNRPVPTAKQRLKILEEVFKRGRSVSSVCSDYSISRTVFYKWSKRYDKNASRNENLLNLREKQRQATNIVNQTPDDVVEEVKEIVKENPSISKYDIANRLKQRVGKDKAVGVHGVYNILKRSGLNTLEKRKKWQEYVIDAKKRILTPEERFKMIRASEELGTPVVKVCSQLGVSRQTYYKWKKRWLESGKDNDALRDRLPQYDRSNLRINDQKEDAILNIILEAPDLSKYKIAEKLKEGFGLIVSPHGVYNVLLRRGLNTTESRFAYARTHVPVTYEQQGQTDRVVSTLEQFIPTLAPAPPPALTTIFNIFKYFTVVIVIIYATVYSLSWWVGLVSSQTMGVAVGTIFSTIALTMGSFFFLYSLKYYITLAVVLSYSQAKGTLVGEGSSKRKTKKSFIPWILSGANGNNKTKDKVDVPGAVGLESNMDAVTLDKKPFVSIHIPFFNEKQVVKRAMEAVTKIDYEEYEVILCDDSTDETSKIIRDYQKQHLAKDQKLQVIEGEGWTLTKVTIRPGVTLKHLHRTTRSGFKGGALKLALTLVDPRTEFISIFDADFVPYPDTLSLFLKYFKTQNNMSEDYSQSNVAVVQGYQWHVLNKSENWVTRGVRSEYAGSYVIERSGQEIYGGLKHVSGSVYMIRRGPLEEVGWETSITEDYELTLKLYEKGYKVVFTPYIQAPAECVSTLKRLIKQRMRWSEGHSYNVKVMWKRLLFNPRLTIAEKVEFLFNVPYYLQAFFFLIGTTSWIISETIFQAKLPFWTSLWGWSLVLTNMFALPLVNAVGLFLEESEEKDYAGLVSFVVLSYIVMPFQAYASVKGFLEKEEGPWFRTPKTGLITDVFSRGKFYRFISGLLPGRIGQPAAAQETQPSHLNKYVALATANNQFNSFSVKPRRIRWLGKAVLSVMLAFTVSLYSITKGVPEVLATNPSTTQYLTNNTTSTLNNSWTVEGSIDTGSDGTTQVNALKASTLQRYAYRPGSSGAVAETTCGNGSATGYGWILDTPFETGGTIATGIWQFDFYESDSPNTQASGTLEVCAYKVTVSSGSITGSTLIYDSSSDGSWPATDIINNAVDNTSYTTSSISQVNFSVNEYIYVQFSLDLTGTAKDTTTSFYSGNIGTPTPKIIFPTITIPENVIYLAILTPLVPFMAMWIRKRKGIGESKKLI